MTGKARHAHAATHLVLEALWSHVRPAVCVPEGTSLGMWFLPSDHDPGPARTPGNCWFAGEQQP